MEATGGLIPPIEITSHGRQRLFERLGVSERKIDKLLKKAWLSPEPPIEKIRFGTYQASFRRNHDRTQYRFLMGYVFVFDASNRKIIFVTVYN